MMTYEVNGKLRLSSDALAAFGAHSLRPLAAGERGGKRRDKENRNDKPNKRKDNDKR